MSLTLKNNLELLFCFVAKVVSIRLHESQQCLVPHYWHLRHLTFLLIYFGKSKEEVYEKVKGEGWKGISLGDQNFDKVTGRYVLIHFSQFDKGRCRME